jgi:hypothetical protein
MFALTHFPMRTSTCSLQYIEHYLHSQYYSRSTSYSHITQLLPWLTLANLAAAAALWVSHNSVSAFVMKLFSALQPHVVAAIEAASSKIHISFDGWTTKGRKRGLLGIVAHFATVDRDVVDLPIDLPQLTGAHTSERLAEVVTSTLTSYSITPAKLSYFVLDNASNNDTTVAALARSFDFIASYRRLRCGPHTLNLVGKMIIFSRDKGAYDNASSNLDDKERFLQEWRKDGPLGTLIAIINYIKTPQQYDLFSNF